MIIRKATCTDSINSVLQDGVSDAFCRLALAVNGWFLRAKAQSGCLAFILLRPEGRSYSNR
jgi:hypothetical protein